MTNSFFLGTLAYSRNAIWFFAFARIAGIFVQQFP
jgi:hypothetical protein